MYLNILLHFIISFASVDSFFFIYEWGKYLDLFPNNPNMSEWQDYRSNHGAGKLVNAKLGLFNTYNYALHKLSMSRLARHHLRTEDYRMAKIFFIPYDMGMDTMVSNKTGRYKIDRDSIGHCPRARQVISFMKNEPPAVFKNFLHDHVLIFSISHGHPLKKSCKVS